MVHVTLWAGLVPLADNQKTLAVEAKWNFEGTGFVLWAPRGPGFGRAEALLDGLSLGVVDFKADAPQPSAPVLAKTDLPGMRHALKLRPVEGAIPADVLEVAFP